MNKQSDKNQLSAQEELSQSDILEILKSEVGFSSELKAYSAFLAKDAVPYANVFYIDQETGKPREIDILAKISMPFTPNEVPDHNLFQLHVVCDVKSTSAPTVIFSSQQSKNELSTLHHAAFFYEDRDEPFVVRQDRVREVYDRSSDAKRVGRNVVKVLSKPERESKNRVNDSWYRDALFSITKASRFFLNESTHDLVIDFMFEKNPCAIVLMLPMIVIDGPLFELFYESGVEKLEPVSWIPFRFGVPRSVFGNAVDADSASRVDYQTITFCHLTKIEEFIVYTQDWIRRFGSERIDVLFEMHREQLRRRRASVAPTE